MRYVVAILAAVVLFAMPVSAQAQWSPDGLLSGDSPTPWGYGWSPSGQYYQPTPAQSYQWAAPYATAAYSPPAYTPSWTSQPAPQPTYRTPQISLPSGSRETSFASLGADAPAPAQRSYVSQWVDEQTRAAETRDIVRSELSRQPQQLGWR